MVIQENRRSPQAQQTKFLLDLVTWAGLIVHLALSFTQTGTADYEPCVAIFLFRRDLPLDENVLVEWARIAAGVLKHKFHKHHPEQKKEAEVFRNKGFMLLLVSSR
jgi:hypothetical protein